VAEWADNAIPLTLRFLDQFRGQSSFTAWLINPLIGQGLPASSVATAEKVRDVAMGLVSEACDVADLGICDARKV
jgi:hypothetical protein